MSLRFAGVMLFLSLLAGGCAVEPAVAPRDNEKSAQLNAEMGVRYMLQGNYPLALEKLEKALTYDPDYSPAHHYLGELYRRLERPREADAHFRAAIVESPEEPALLNNYGVFLCEQGRFAEAEGYFRKVLEDPVYRGRARVYENMGLCAKREPDAKKAENYFRKALAANPRLPQSLLAMAQLSFEDGNFLSTRAYLQRFAEVAAHTPESLWLGLRTERMLGNEQLLASYAERLRKQFPDSEETKRYLKSVQP